MGIIDSENPHSLFDPELDNAFELLPKRSPMWRLEFKRIDILIFFRRILRVLHSPIRTPSKPFRMLSDIGMIRRTLVGEIKGNFYAVLFSFSNKMAKVFEPAKLRVDCFVAAFLGPYSPRTSRITGPGFACVVFAFTMGMADRVNRREVENVETHFRNL